MTFSDDLSAHRANVRRNLHDVFVGCTEEVQRSLTEGSPLTGAPGVPVQSGDLKGSYIPALIAPWTWRSVTKLVYAPFIEGGNYTQRSPVGGPHSVKLTRAGWPNIVEWNGRRFGVNARATP